MKKSHLTLHKRFRFPNQKEPGPPPPIEIEGEMEYAVKEIRGYPNEGDTWEPIENLKDAHDAIEEFLGNDTPTLQAQQITISHYRLHLSAQGSTSRVICKTVP